MSSRQTHRITHRHMHGSRYICSNRPHLLLHIATPFCQIHCMSCIHTTRNWRRSTIPPVQLAHSNRNDSPAFRRSLFAGRSDQSVNSAVRCRLGDGRMQAGATRQHQEYEQRSNNASIQFYTTVLSSRKR